MKKILKYVVVFLLTAATLLTAGACRGSGVLNTPSNFSINDDLLLSWASVRQARSYDVEIASDSETVKANVRRTEMSLADLKEGDYDIRLRAVGGANNDVFSEWSETLAFHRDHEVGLVYTLINNNMEYQVRNVGSAEGDLVLESTYRGKPVTSIGALAFRNAKAITSVVIPDSVTEIGSMAFYNASELVSIYIPESVTSIAQAAFQGCSRLKDITLLAKITKIAPYTFSYCRSLETIELGAGIEVIGEYAFNNCSALLTIDIPDAVTEIGTRAFAQATALKEVNFGSGINFVGNYAFLSCNALKELNFREPESEIVLGTSAFASCPALESVELPVGVTTIGNTCFSGDSALEEIKIPSSVRRIGAMAFDKTALYLAQEAAEDGDYAGQIYADNWLIGITQEYYDTLQVIDEYTFRAGTVGISAQAMIKRGLAENEEGVQYYTYFGPTNLSRIRFPQSMRFIGAFAFYQTLQLQRVLATYQNSIEFVDEAAFMGCPILNNVQFAAGLLEINDYAFMDCVMLDNNSSNNEVLIPGTVNRVGTYVYYNTRLWNSDSVTDGIVYAGNWVVGYDKDKFKSKTVELRDGTVGICDYAFFRNVYLQNISGTSQVRIIGQGAFAQCPELSSISLNQSITEIRPYTFLQCPSLYNVSFPSQLRKIGQGAFYECGFLSVDLSGTRVTEIGRDAFRRCENLLNLVLSDDLKTIDKYAFYDCTRLWKVDLPDSVASIGTRAFGYCSNLAIVNFGSGLEEIEPYTFRDCTSLYSIELPEGVKRVGEYAFYNCKEVEKISLPETLEGIDRYAFYGVKHVKSVVIPANVAEIGNNAFKNCASLTTIADL